MHTHHRWTMAAAAALGTLVLTACGSEPAGHVVPGRSADADARVVIDEGAFNPQRLELDAAGMATIEVTNEDFVEHDFAVEAQGLNTGSLAGGESATAEVEVGSEPVVFVCTLHPGMKGVIVAG